MKAISAGQAMGVQDGSKLRNGNGRRLPDPDCAISVERTRRERSPRKALRGCALAGCQLSGAARAVLRSAADGAITPADPSQRPSPVVTTDLSPFPRRRADSERLKLVSTSRAAAHR